jgi:hypothetical protein
MFALCSNPNAPYQTNPLSCITVEVIFDSFLQVLQQLADCMTPHIIDKPKKYYTWGETLVPDVWFDAVKVCLLVCVDLQ